MNKITNQKEKNILIKRNSIIYINGSCNLDAKITIDKTNMDIDVKVLVILKGNDEANIKFDVLHTISSTNSRVEVRSVLGDNAVLDVECVIDVSKTANNTDSYFKNDNLVLSNDTKITTSPILQIKNNTAKASHGVTIKTLDEYEEFVMSSRGLSKRLTKEILIKGFTNSLLNNIDATKNLDIITF